MITAIIDVSMDVINYEKYVSFTFFYMVNNGSMQPLDNKVLNKA